jgi:hypothetical protein
VYKHVGTLFLNLNAKVLVNILRYEKCVWVTEVTAERSRLSMLLATRVHVSTAVRTTKVQGHYCTTSQILHIKVLQVPIR